MCKSMPVPSSLKDLLKNKKHKKRIFVTFFRSPNKTMLQRYLMERGGRKKILVNFKRGLLTFTSLKQIPNYTPILPQTFCFL